MILNRIRNRYSKKTPLKKVMCKREDRKDYDFKEWDSQAIRDPDLLRKKLDDMKLAGRVMTDFYFISHVYNMTENGIGETLWRLTEGYPKELQDYMSEIDNIDDMFPYPLDIEMDEPMLIRFEDGEHLEIFTPVEEYYNISMNQIPWNTKGVVNMENINASILLDFCKGGTITKAEVLTEYKETGEEYVTGIRISWEANQDTYSLVFESDCHDYMNLTVISDWYNHVICCPFITVKKSIYKD